MEFPNTLEQWSFVGCNVFDSDNERQHCSRPERQTYMVNDGYMLIITRVRKCAPVYH